MREFCGALARRIDQTVDKVVVFLFAALLLDVWLAILDRYVLKLQIVWTEEAARYLMVWAMLLAVVTATYRRQHVFISFLYEKFPPKSRLVLATGLDILSMLSCFAIGLLAIPFAASVWDSSTSVFGMPLSIPYAAVSVSFVLCGIQLLLMIIRDFGKLPEHNTEIDSAIKDNNE